MPPKRQSASDPLDILHNRLTRLEEQVRRLQTEKISTVPTYDPTNVPAFSIEGQTAIHQHLVSNKVFKADGTSENADIGIDFIATPKHEIWITSRVAIPAAAYALWSNISTSAASTLFTILIASGSTAFTLYTQFGNWFDGATGASADFASTVTPDTWMDFEVTFKNDGTTAFYINTVLIFNGSGSFTNDATFADVGGINNGDTDTSNIIYYDDTKVGTTRGASDVALDDFESGVFSIDWTFIADAASIVDDPYA